MGSEMCIRDRALTVLFPPRRHVAGGAQLLLGGSRRPEFYFLVTRVNASWAPYGTLGYASPAGQSMRCHVLRGQRPVCASCCSVVLSASGTLEFCVATWQCDRVLDAAVGRQWGRLLVRAWAAESCWCGPGLPARCVEVDAEVARDAPRVH